MESDKREESSPANDITKQVAANTDKEWIKWVAKCKELDKDNISENGEKGMDSLHNKVNDLPDNIEEDVIHGEASHADTKIVNECKNSQNGETSTGQSDEATSLHILKRTTTAPELFGKRIGNNKVLKKRNTLPANLTKTLLMVGRLHDVGETVLEEKLKYIELCDKKSNSEADIVCDANISRAVEKEEIKLNVNQNDDKCDIKENTENDDKQSDQHLIPSVENKGQFCSEDRVLVDRDLAAKPGVSIGDTTQENNIEVVPSNATGDLEAVAANIEIQLNDNVVKTNPVTSTEVPDETQTVESDAAGDQPCVINVSSCSTAAMEPENTRARPVDENLLFVGDPDTSSLNGFDVSETDTVKETTQPARYSR